VAIYRIFLNLKAFMTTIAPTINLLPIGSWHFQGPHLPFDVDTRLSILMANFLCDLIKANPDKFQGIPASLMPPLSASCTQGSIDAMSLRPATLLAVLDDLAAQCVGPLVLVDMTRNNRVLENWVVARNQAGLPTSLLPRDLNWQKACEAAGIETPLDVDGAGGEIKTSLAMAYLPDLVRTKHIPESFIPTLEARAMWTLLGVQSATGVVGQPNKASAEKGQRLAEDLIYQGLTELQSLLA
jgi:creatinine amidohydrolase